MTDVKAKLSYAEWVELLKPYGWADITMRGPAILAGSAFVMEWEIRLMLNADSGISDEWQQRARMLGRAKELIGAVRAAGYLLRDPPRIEFRGDYQYVVGDKEPTWLAQADVYFTVSEF